MESDRIGRDKAKAGAAPWLLAALAACAGGPVAHVDRHPDGRPSRSGMLVGGLQQGEWQFFHPSGRREAVGSYRDDVRTGHWQHWHENGNPSMAGRYEGERQVGWWRFWHGNGRLQCEGAYLDGREHGPWRFFGEDGGLQQSGCFENGRRVLTWRTFEGDGALASQGLCCEDRPAGVWQQRGADGAVREIAYPCSGDVRHVCESWQDGGVRREGLVRGGVPAGLWVSWHPNGAVRCFGTLREGRAEGTWSFRDAEGELVARGPFAAGRMHGTWRVRGAGGEVELPVADRPLPPWNGAWSEGDGAAAGEPLQVAARWIGEVTSPLPVAGTPVAAAQEAGTGAAPAEEGEPPPVERPEAPTDPGAFTVREMQELETYRRYYRDGFLPRRPGLGQAYGADPRGGRLGHGDPECSAGLIGRRLPVTRFLDAEGRPFDLEALRGRNVLLVVLRGFTSQVCVYCFAQTAELAPFAERLRELECELVVLFPGSRSRLEAFQRACADEFADGAPPYRMVYDPDLELAKGLGIDGNLARPTSLILDRTGVVRHAYVAENEANIADRPPASELVAAVERLVR